MKVFSASRREDMPAFHMNELMARYRKEGDDAFWVLWTKNPYNLLMAEMGTFNRIALQMTITGLGGTEWEPNVPPAAKVFETLSRLISMRGLDPSLINWRFDPIINANAHGVIETLAPMAQRLGITRCITSFVTFYGVVKSRWADWEQSQFSEAQQVEIIKHIKGVLNKHGIALYGCVQPHLAGLIQPSACVDGAYYADVTGFDFNTHKDKYQRQHCNCTASQDIGKYRKCAHGCVYCYSRENQDEQVTQDIDMDEV